MRDDDTGLAASLRVSLARLSRRLRTEQAGEAGTTAGLGASGLAVLGRLGRDGAASIGQLATAEQVRPPSMTRTVGCLERDGLVQRHAHPTDGRQVVVRLTEEGAALLAGERRRRDAWLAVRLRELPPDDLDVLRRAAPILERLSNA